MNLRWIYLAITTVAMCGAGHARADDALAQNSGCLECHASEQKRIGPSFHDIAARYRGDARARQLLTETLKNGGKGNWTDITGGVPMPPYSLRLSDAETQRLVDWVLRQ